ncbi:hypothetical protein RAA17_14305 [Komagataeibacter rhaeticus]|nr:hypothetical protein [Komagataeibacter rhaeticus]
MDALRAERDAALAARTALEADLARATEQASTARTRASRAVIRAEARAMAARMGRWNRPMWCGWWICPPSRWPRTARRRAGHRDGGRA